MDVLLNITKEYKVLDHGSLRIVDVMPRLVQKDHTADSAIVQMARVSYGEGTKTLSDDTTLIRYLMRHQHWTPFEGVELKFHIVCPLFVARQIHRHRTASINEYSLRYSLFKDRFYVPEKLNKQSKNNKQGSTNETIGPDNSYMLDPSEQYKKYNELIKLGVSREQARIILPMSAYTEFYWKCDLRNVFNFIKLRIDQHAQYEIRVYAEAMLKIVRQIVPIATQAFEDYILNSITLSALEIKSYVTESLSVFNNKREKEEFKNKMINVLNKTVLEHPV